MHNAIFRTASHFFFCHIKTKKYNKNKIFKLKNKIESNQSHAKVKVNSKKNTLSLSFISVILFLSFSSHSLFSLFFSKKKTPKVNSKQDFFCYLKIAYTNKIENWNLFVCVQGGLKWWWWHDIGGGDDNGVTTSNSLSSAHVWLERVYFTRRTPRLRRGSVSDYHE